MDNSQIFDIAAHIHGALIKAEYLPKETAKDSNCKQTIYRAIKQSLPTNIDIDTSPIDQQDNQTNQTNQTNQNTIRFKLAESLTNDGEYARVWYVEEMAKAAKAGNAAAAKELRDVLQIASNASDLAIEVIDYSTAIIDCPHCGGNIHQQAQQGV